MEGKFYHKAVKCLMAFLFAIINFVSVSAQRFETREAYFSGYKNLTRTIKVKTDTKFSIKKDNRVTWIDCKAYDNSVIVKATINSLNEKRSCSIILLDETGAPVDTLEVIQYGGKPNESVNTASKAASTSNAKSKKSSSTRITSSSSKSTGGQCAARTKKGTRCSRQVSAGSIYCWQHNK
jgi:hypothetical protein